MFTMNFYIICSKTTEKFLYFRKPESKIQTKRPNLRVFCQKDTNGIANSEDPDQTVPLQSDLGLHCLSRPICPKT